jgi:hypothetical protein
MLHAGGRRLEDLRELGEEREVLEQLGLEAVPDAGTVGDWLRRQGKAGAEAVQEVSRGLVEKCLEPEAEEVILDVDATEIEAEKQEAQWTYNHVQGYALARVRERGVRGPRVPRRQSESERRDFGICAKL